MSNLRSYKILFLLFLNIGLAQIYKSPEIIAGKTSEWKNAALCSLCYEFEPGNMVTPEVKTEILICYDNEYIYFGGICYENDMSRLRATRRKPGENHLTDDNLMISINTFINVEEEYVFSVNPYGHQYDFYEGGGGRMGEAWFEDLDFIWKAGTQIFDSCWTFEIAIPFKSLRFPSTEIQVWRLGLKRYRPRDVDYYYSWDPQPHGVFSSFSFRGRLYINEHLIITKQFEFLPYFVGEIKQDSSGLLSFGKRIGVSGKYYFTFNNVLDWAVLPDYSQIESDAPQIDVNTTSALYYEEKRPFFMERKSLFETPIEVFYSRTINDPLIAIKFTADTKNLHFGYISAYDQHTLWFLPFKEASFLLTSNYHSFSNVLRTRKNITGQSFVGLLAVSRDIKKNGFSRYLGLDGKFYFLNNFTFDYQGLLTWNKEIDDTILFGSHPEADFSTHTSSFDGEEFIGSGFYLNLAHNSKHLNLAVKYTGLSPEFRVGNGYIPYNDFEIRSMIINGILYLNKYYIETFKPGLELTEKREFLGRPRELEKKISFTLQLYRQSYLNLSYKITNTEYKGYKFKDLNTYNLGLSTSPVQHLSLSGYFIYGRQIDYNALPPQWGDLFYPSLRVELNIRHLRLESSFARYLLWQNNTKQVVYDSRVYRQEINWVFTKSLNFRILGQHSSSSNIFSISILFSFEPTRFTLFYLGSNHTLLKSENSGLLDFESQDNSFFLKIQYQIRR